MTKEVEKSDLQQTYYLIQKNIGSNWEARGRFTSKEEAITELDKKIAEETTKNDKFIYRLIKIEELALYKSKEKKPDDMLDVF